MPPFLQVEVEVNESSFGSAVRQNGVVILVVFATVVSFSLHLLNLSSTINSDEIFYRTAALTMINHVSCGPLNALASLQPCNLEHPPFAKLLMAASMEVFGTGDMGTRLPSIISGVLSIPALAWLASSLSGGNRKSITIAAVLLSTSPTWFLLSSVGMLDSIELFFGILALAVYFSRIGGRWEGLALTGFLMGLSVLSKEDGILILAGLVSYEFLFGSVRRTMYAVAFSVVTVIAVLSAYDLLFSPFNNPLQHVLFVIQTDLRLRYQGGFLVGPLQWFFQPREILISVFSLAWVPTAVLLIYRRRLGRPSILAFSLFLLIATLVPQVILYYVDHRQEYLFYHLQVIPALVLGVSGIFARRVPWILAMAVLSAAIAIFFYNFQFLLSVYNDG